MTLLDIGCGWGATMRRAVERYDVNVVGLTLSENQHDHAEQAFAALDSPRSKRVLSKGGSSSPSRSTGSSRSARSSTSATTVGQSLLRAIGAVEEHATAAGFTVARIQSLQPHYARTLDTWAQALGSRRDEAIAVQSEEVYDRYMRYLTGCADMFHKGYIDVNQFTLQT